MRRARVRARQVHTSLMHVKGEWFALRYVLEVPLSGCVHPTCRLSAFRVSGLRKPGDIDNLSVVRFVCHHPGGGFSRIIHIGFQSDPGPVPNY